MNSNAIRNNSTI
uniref:Uncharacterized protein n=1 Tax=Arundo donax TaxID=35708 RepID=A0A0A9FU97_ARUDO